MSRFCCAEIYKQPPRTQSFTYSILGKTRPDDSPPPTHPPQPIVQDICKPEPNVESVPKPVVDTFKTKRVAHRYPPAQSKDSADRFENGQNTGSLAFPIPTIPNHGPNGLDKFGHFTSNGIHPMLLESTKEVQQYQPPRHTLPANYSSNTASTPTNETSRVINVQNDFSFLRKISAAATQSSQIDRNQLIPLHPHQSRFADEHYIATLLRIAERQFSASRTTAAQSSTTPSQTPMESSDKPVSLSKSGPVDAGEPLIRPHPKVQLKDLYRVERIMTIAIQDGFSNFASIPDLNAPKERQYASSNPPPSEAPCTVPDEPPNVRVNTKPFKLPKFNKIKFTPEEPLESERSRDFQPLCEPEPSVNSSQDPWEDYVPSPIPEELQALINAYICGRPFNLIVARSRLYHYWNLALPEEFEYVMIGFFRVLSVQVRLRFPFMNQFLKNDL